MSGSEAGGAEGVELQELLGLPTIVWKRDGGDAQPRTEIEGGCTVGSPSENGRMANRVVLTAISAAANTDPSPIAIGIRALLVGLKLGIRDPELACAMLASMGLTDEEHAWLRSAAAWITDRAGKRDN